MNKNYLKLLKSVSNSLIRNLHKEAFNENVRLEKLIETCEGRLLYNSFVENKKLNFGFHGKLASFQKFLQRKNVDRNADKHSIPYVLKHLIPDPIEDDLNLDKTQSQRPEEQENWMTNYEAYDDSITEGIAGKINFGTPNPKVPISNVPCGGCGANLHCKDVLLPGYIPSEIYRNYKDSSELKGIVCQRCHFLQQYGILLPTKVATKDYIRLLRSVKDEKGLVVLLVDLVDAASSIWPDVMHAIGMMKSVVIVGTKIDLLPIDRKDFSNEISRVLQNDVEKITGLSSRNIKHVALISAKTGFGIEGLITKLHSLWDVKGNVYLVGCTNTGKSTLFNALLQTDYCKVQAVDLVQRATTSQLPETTLSLLKFPILRPSHWRVFARNQRLASLRIMQAKEKTVKGTKPKYESLAGDVSKTFSVGQAMENTADPFSISINRSSGKVQKGLNEDDEKFSQGKWCYDTPGIVHSEQIFQFFTEEELNLIFPKVIIHPRTFKVTAGSTLYIGGIARVDFLQVSTSILISVFCSKNLPITICPLEDADFIYKELLGTDLFNVPKGDENRMKNWPGLKNAEDFVITGTGRDKSSADIILSTAGWISITSDKDCTVRAFTPEGRGIRIRDSLLPRAFSYRGKKIRNTPAYER